MMFDKDVPSIDKDTIERVYRELTDREIYQTLKYAEHHEIPKPSLERIKETMSILRGILFPGYFSEWKDREELHREMKDALKKSADCLIEEAFKSFCFDCQHPSEKSCEDCRDKAKDAVEHLMDRLPSLREQLLKDVKVGYEHDPAAKSVDEVILAYPTIKALSNYRVAHELYKKDVTLIPRIIAEIAHSETGIDIHPGAAIEEYLFTDHGTGIVVGETCEIGSGVRIYQGVTLGAKSFSLDEDGKPVKGILRHPIIEDDVIMYAGATVLGRVTVGEGSVIGSNVTVTEDVEPSTRLQR